MRRQALLLLAGIAFVACTANGETATTDSPSTATAAPSSTTAPSAGSTSPAEATGDGAVSVSLQELRGDLGIDTLALDPAIDDGPHPVLSWQPVDGAASYWLVLHDADGAPYWAWTGTETSVRVGGGDSPDLNQTAAIHNEITWSVAAFDEEENLIALSDVASGASG